MLITILLNKQNDFGVIHFQMQDRFKSLSVYEYYIAITTNFLYDHPSMNAMATRITKELERLPCASQHTSNS